MHSMLANNAPGKRMDRLCVTGRLEFSDAKMQNISPVGYSGLCITHEHSAQKRKVPCMLELPSMRLGETVAFTYVHTHTCVSL